MPIFAMVTESELSAAVNGAGKSNVVARVADVEQNKRSWLPGRNGQHAPAVPPSSSVVLAAVSQVGGFAGGVKTLACRSNSCPIVRLSYLKVVLCTMGIWRGSPFAGGYSRPVL